MTNQLADSSSLYLQQHAQNPVHWQMWNEEVFEKAKKEDKPVLVSIGYAACHWCHVMEHESFEDKEVANFMNEHFICIKVDREEYPAVDHQYMDALQAMNGQGGWPLNMFVTPDKEPFYGGTYFPPRPMYNRASWMQVLENIHQLWNEKRDKINHQAKQIIAHLSQVNTMPTPDLKAEYNRSLAVNNVLQQADKLNGGFGPAPKFPNTMTLQFLLTDYYFSKNEKSLQHVIFTLDKMLQSGIYDAVGGGFFRYATDNEWKIPHFEKMLYDQALMIQVLVDAYKITKKESYKKAIYETINFCYLELFDDGLFMSSIDADSDGVEGLFYTLTLQEVAPLINEQNNFIIDLFDIREIGNWEETNILHQVKSKDIIAEENNISIEKLENELAVFLKKIFQLRNDKIRPATDSKKQLSWNALMNIAIVKAANAFSDDELLQKATAHMNAMQQHFNNSDALLHLKYDTKMIQANADDWNYLIQAYIQLGNATMSQKYFDKAQQLYQHYQKEFSAEDLLFFNFENAKNKTLPNHKVDIYDGALPSVNAVACQNLLQLGILFSDFEMIERSRLLWQSIKSQIEQYPTSFGYWNNVVACFETYSVYKVVGNLEKEKIKLLLANNLPDKLFIQDESSNSKGKKPFVQECNKYSCLSPLELNDEWLETFC